jgi:multiple sugar transport system substrate-binding protein
MKRLWTTFLVAAAMVFTFGCANSNPSSPDSAATAGSTTPEVKESPAPVTVKLRLSAAYLDVFHKYMDSAIQKKYPHITVEYTDESQKLPDVVAAGNVPDIIYVSGINLWSITDLNLQYDMNSLIKKYNFDLNKIDPSLIQGIKQYASNGELYGLPADRSVVVTLYNKDLFDRFNVAYPKDGMTWDDAIALAKKLTRTVDGVNYQGLSTNVNNLKSQLQLHRFGKNGDVLLTTPEWQKLAAMWKKINEIPGNYFNISNRNTFSKDRTVAMRTDNSVWLLRNPIPDFNWDYTTMPTFDNGLINDWLGATLTISSTSKNKDAAFQIIDLYFSDEIQTQISRNAALVPISTSPEIVKQWAANSKGSEGKNLQTDFHGKPATRVIEKYSDIADAAMNPFFIQIAEGQADINTALRQAEEAANAKVKAQITK